MPKTQTSFSQKVIAFISHRYFFVFIAALFLVQMLWIAFSNVYPMLFDEEYHLGVIEIYSRQISPFIASQPPEAAFHGDITRYNSYLFHYLMSFPYRIVTLFTNDLTSIVISMRLICIALVMVGFYLYKKALQSFGVSRAITNATLLIFSLIPIVPFALSQINYDALKFVWVPLLFLLAKKASLKSELQAWFVGLLVAVSGLAAITKFTALPIIVGCFVFVGFYLQRQYGRAVFKKLFVQYKLLPRAKLILTSLLLLLSLGLVAERYGYNLVAYQALEPACDRLHTTKQCLEYTVFKRNYTRQADYEQKDFALQNPYQFTKDYWAPHIFGDFFVVGAFVYKDQNQPSLRYLPPTLQARSGNPILKYSAVAILVISLLILVFAAVRRRFKPAPLLAITFLVLAIYASSHWIKNYSDYLTIGSGVAAQGRYYIPLLVFVLASVAMATRHLLPSVKARLIVFLILLLPLTQGGGVAGYILNSNQSWYWPSYHTTIDANNQAVRRVLRSFTPF